MKKFTILIATLFCSANVYAGKPLTSSMIGSYSSHLRGLNVFPVIVVGFLHVMKKKHQEKSKPCQPKT